MAVFVTDWYVNSLRKRQCSDTNSQERKKTLMTKKVIPFAKNWTAGTRI